MTEDHWTEDPGAKEFLNQLKGQLKAQIELLLSNAEHCVDPEIRSNWTAIAVFRRVIAELEAERAKPSK